jgi:hypothetical protein
MTRLETIDGSNWREFLAAPRAVLILAKTTCAACAAWSDELSSFLGAADPRLEGVRIGKMYLDRPGLIDFKRGNPWLAEVEDLPFNLLYERGERRKSWPGGGVERLVDRLAPPAG